MANYIKNNFLKQSFFYDKDMRKQEDIVIAGDCIQQLVAIIMKKKYEGKYNPYAVYMDDISFNISIDMEGFLTRSGIKSNEIMKPYKLFEFNKIRVKNDVTSAMKAVSATLAKEGYVILRTVDAYLPFSRYYNPDFNFNMFTEKGHVIMLIGEDDYNYYFVEQLEELNIANYKSIESRRDIGVCEKRIFERSLSLYTEIIIVDFFEDSIKSCEEFANEIMYQSVCHYNNNVFTRKIENVRIKILGGHEALNWLQIAAELEKFQLNKKVFHPGLNNYCTVEIGQEMMNGVTGLKNRRIVLKKFLENTDIRKNEQLVSTIDESIKVFEQLKKQIIKMIYKKDYNLKKEEIKYIKNIIEAEEKMFRYMEEYLVKV